jgi:glycerol-3-phosphate dehydrogenase (NAD(P)+)
MSRFAILSAGSWGTAFAKIVADAEPAEPETPGGELGGRNEAVLWARRDDLATAINEKRENPDYLPGIRLPERVSATSDAGAALDGADFVVLALPAQTLRANLAELRPVLDPDTPLVSLMKGIELNTCKRMTEVITETTGASPARVAVVTGPNLAPEIALGQPAAAVVASTDPELATRLQHACRTSYFRPYTNSDVIGCELGGAVKNVIALAVGIADGMGFGDNAKASLITRGLAETARLGAALGADPYTFAGLAGLGDLVATCASPLSRNRTFGANLGRGMRLDEVVAVTRQTAEGVKSCESIMALARRHGIDMPITETVVAIVHDGRSPAEMLGKLMGRAAKPERGL